MDTWSTWHGLTGLLGSALIVLAYALLEARRLSSDGWRYFALNGAGAALVIVSLAFAFNLAAFVVEAFWVVISVVGLVRALGARRRVAPTSSGAGDAGTSGPPRP